MGRKKKRRGRDRAFDAAASGGVETIDFAVDEMPASASPPPRPAPVEVAPPEPVPQVPEAAAPPADPGGAVQTLGELLQQAREARGLCIEEASARTRISGLMLQHLESDRFGEFAADAYVKGFLRNYGSFLGLDVAMLLRRYEAISGRTPEREPELLEVETPSRSRVRRRHGRAWIAVVACAVTAVLCWVFWSRGATRWGLRPTPDLQQIETELQERPAPARPAPPDAQSANDRADIQQKQSEAVEMPRVAEPVAVPPPPRQTPAAAAPATPPVRAKAAAKPSPPPRPKPAERGPIEDLVPPTPR